MHNLHISALAAVFITHSYMSSSSLSSIILSIKCQIALTEYLRLNINAKESVAYVARINCHQFAPQNNSVETVVVAL